MSKLNKKLVKSIAKELEKSALLSDAYLSSVAGGASFSVILLKICKDSIQNAVSTPILGRNGVGSYK